MLTVEESLEKRKKELEKFVEIRDRLANLTPAEKNQMIYKIGYLDGNYNKLTNFFTYFKKSDFCKNIFTNKIDDINYFRDKIVEQISEDYLSWLEPQHPFTSDREKMDYKFNLIGLMGELFNIYYLENISTYRNSANYRQRFKNVVPFNIFFNQNDWGADLICVDSNNEICVFQVKFYSTWSMKSGNKIELKKHCFGSLLESMRLVNNDIDYLEDHVFITILGDKTKDVSISLQKSPYKDYIKILDNSNYFNDIAGDETLFTDFYNFLMKI